MLSSFFQLVQDQLYLTPSSVTEHTGLTALYLGALGFTEPLEQLVLCTVPLQCLLDWLSKPKGPNLVEASVAAAPEKSLVLAVTKKMLFLIELYSQTAYMEKSLWHNTDRAVKHIHAAVR